MRLKNFLGLFLGVFSIVAWSVLLLLINHAFNTPNNPQGMVVVFFNRQNEMLLELFVIPIVILLSFVFMAIILLQDKKEFRKRYERKKS
jgi:uncharacterized membrane protein